MSVGISDRYSGITKEQIESCRGEISGKYFAILTASLSGNYAEIATVLDMKRGTVKSRLNRARAALAKALMAIETQKPEANQ